DGVTSCAVSLLTNSMGVQGNADPQKIIQAVKAAGYGAALAKTSNGGKTDSCAANGCKTGNDGGAAKNATQDQDPLSDKESPVLVSRLAISLIFLVPLMYFSMGRQMLGLALPKFFEGNCVAVGLVQLLLAVAVMVVNKKFFANGFSALFRLAPNMDSLVALGSGASILYSAAVLFLMTEAVAQGDSGKAHELLHDLYFEGAAMILALITVGKTLEARSKGKTTNALKSLMKLAPKTATVIRDGKELVIPATQILVGEIFVVRPGQSFPVDGTVVEGNGAVDESALTGESVPVDKKAGDKVFGGTLNQAGFLKCQASRVGQDTTISQIIKMVGEAAATKAPAQKIADKVSGVFVPAVIAIAALTVAAWLLAGQDFGFALARGISVLVISCPCALGLATPVAIMVANGVGAKNGILFKTAAALEQTGKTKIAALDKTGTITQGRPRVTDIFCAQGVGQQQLLEAALSLESKSEHPLAKAVLQKASELSLTARPVTDFKALAGSGVLATDQDGSQLLGGSVAFVQARLEAAASGAAKTFPQEALAAADAFAEQGKTPLAFARANKLLGIIAVADVIKEDSAAAIKDLRALGVETVMLTGDNQKAAAFVARQAGVGQV
ncbi:MAG: heavy metal translocating P-type ATPase, partial [Treponema sp.]|nr:heavy metal translocating P-type ATPase [Treponema sp.]